MTAKGYKGEDMKFRALIAATSAVAVLAVAAYAATEIDLEKITCVMNPKNPAQPKMTAKHHGGLVFFCCENCPAGFAKKVKTDKLIMARANHQLVATKQAAQEKCPFSGGPAKATTAIKVGEAGIAFCCNNCKGKAEKMKGEEQLIALFGADAFKKASFKVGKHDSSGKPAE